MQYINYTKRAWAEFKEVWGCKTDFYKTCARELTALHTLLQSPSLSSLCLASPTQCNTSPYCKGFLLNSPGAADVFSSTLVPSTAENGEESTEQEGKGGIYMFSYWRLRAGILSKVWETKVEFISYSWICASRQDFEGTVQAFCFSVERCKAHAN